MTWTIEDRRVLVTGSTSGIGKAAAIRLADAGAHVTITSRNPEKGSATAAEVRASTGIDVDVLGVDFADLGSVRKAAGQFLDTHDDLAVLINNAGAVIGKRSVTVDGYETTFATNHLGPFLFTYLLTDLLLTSTPSRVINTSSVAHTYAKEGIVLDDLGFDHREYRFMEVYGHSKLANILHAQELNARFGSQGLTALAVHPGVVRTGLGSGGDSFIVGLAYKFGGRWMRSPDDGADTIVWLATEPNIKLDNGIYFEDRAPSKSTRHARDMDQARRLWTLSEELTGVSGQPRSGGPMD
ncbi:MAG: SDR family NAD(P)-dependent oxidoreductase [Acidimicrobiia bacterium]|nr:MAG: SDR family NAD(P)-dependent oxidoreductase [Acidimicrobiia bacterium]